MCFLKEEIHTCNDQLNAIFSLMFSIQSIQFDTFNPSLKQINSWLLYPDTLISQYQIFSTQFHLYLQTHFNTYCTFTQKCINNFCILGYHLHTLCILAHIVCFVIRICEDTLLINYI